MKRCGNLWDSIISIENLQLADEKARKGKIHSWGVTVHDRRRDQNIRDLHVALKNKTFKTSEYETFTIYEPKERVIFRLPYYPDRIVHHAVMNIMEPIWVKIFTSDTYSCIKDRGIHACANAVKKALHDHPEETKYCLKIDVRKFYPSVNHEILKNIIRRKIKDRDLLWLLDEVIDSADGIPIGNYLSQYFANLYLTYFDHWIKEVKHVKYFFRYADDMVFFSDNKAELQSLLIDVRRYLSDNLKLKIKRNFQVFPVDSRGVDFVGYVFRHTHTLLRKRIKQNMCRRVAHLRKIMKRRKIKRKAFEQSVCSWWGWCKYCDSRNFVKSTFKDLPYEVKFKR